ncbi:hypothetical protein CR513_29560, partial [Mucuna pruriens]
MYAQVCIPPYTTFIVRVPKVVKCVMRYLKRTIKYMLTYQKYNSLEIVDYLDSNFVGCSDGKHSTSSYTYMLARISWKSSMKLKFIDIKYLVVKKKHIYIEHIETNYMLANPLRASHIRFFHEHVAQMGVFLEVTLV